MQNAPFLADYRIWIYQTNRPVLEEEQQKIQPELDAFIAEWATHGTQLKGNSHWINPFILVIGVDEKMVMPSGCSIDSCVRFLTKLGASHNIDFFVRMKSVVLQNNEWKQLNFREVAELNNENTKVIDTTLTHWSEFTEKGIVAPLESSLAPLFAN